MPAMSTLQLAVVGWLDELVARHGTTSGPTLPARDPSTALPPVNSRNRMAAFGRTNVMSMAASVEAPLSQFAQPRATPATIPVEGPRRFLLLVWRHGLTQGTRACIARSACR